MSSDNIQRQMEFIIEHQAKFNEDMIRLEQNTRQNTEDITRLVGAVMNLTVHVQENSRQIGELAASGKETDARLKETDARLKETDARLNTLISVAERFFSNGHKG